MVSKPSRPATAATIMAGMTAMARVKRRRMKGVRRQRMKPSEIIWPAKVTVTLEDSPAASKATAKRIAVDLPVVSRRRANA